MINTIRHQSIIAPYEHKMPIHIIGCGATGSWVNTILTRMGFNNIIIYDFDTVEEHNIANQDYIQADIGELKVNATFNKMLNINPDCIISAQNEKVTKRNSFKGIVFCLTDTMSSRKEIWENCIKNKILVDCFIETRMGADQGMIYTINPKKPSQVKAYEQTFYTDDVAETSLCGTSISVLPTAMSIASQAVWQMISFLNNTSYNNEIIINYKNNELFAQQF